MHIDDFAPRLSFFFNAHNDLFRGTRESTGPPAVLWAEIVRNKIRRQARDLLEAAVSRADRRLFTARQTAGGEPDPRLPYQALAAVVWGMPVAAHQ